MLTNNFQDRRLMAFAVILILVHISVIVSLWPDLPNSLPDHFSFNGTPDHWAPKGRLVILPVINASLCLLCFSIWNKTTYFNLPFPITDANRSVQFALAKALIGKIAIWTCLLFITITWMSISHGIRINTLPVQIAFFATFAGLILTIVSYLIHAYRKK